MPLVASRELRNNTRGILRRVEAGEQITITVGGRPVATLQPIAPKPRWISKERLLRHQADPALTRELAEMLPDMTDDLPL